MSYSNLVVAVKYTFEKRQLICGLSVDLSYEKSESLIYNCLKIVVGSILQTLMVFPT